MWSNAILGGEGGVGSEIREPEVALTAIGNQFRIRHSETSQTPIEEDEQVDYLFHRTRAACAPDARLRGSCRGKRALLVNTTVIR